MIARILLALLAGCPATSSETGRITRFGGAADKWRGGESPCTGARIEADEWGVATRKGRCGQLYRITNKRTGKVVVAPKVTSGPYGALLDDGTWTIKAKRSDPGTWRGIVDATPPVFEALGAKSFDRVTLEAL